MYRVSDIPSITVEAVADKQSPITFGKKLRAAEVLSPVFIVVRTFGLFPSCLSDGDRNIEEITRDTKWHRIIHIFFYLYSIFTSGLCLTFAVSGLFFVLLAKDDSTDYNYTVFDVILLWQSSFLSIHCLFIGSKIKVYLNSLDAYFLSQQNEKLSKTELTATVIAFANHTNVTTSYAQTLELENLHPRTDVYKSSRRWCTWLSIVSSVTVFCVIVQNVWAEIEEKASPPPIVTISQYIAISGSTKGWQTFLGTIVGCFSLMYNVLPHVLFVGCAIPLMAFIQSFNERAELSAHNTLDTDKVNEVHYKLRYLVRLLDDCFSSIIFTTIVGDFFQLIFGTYMELTNCSLEGMDAKCSKYFARHVLLLLRLCLTIGTGVTIQERIQGLLPTMEEYSSKSLLNTEKLKLLTLIQSLPVCGISGSSFFLITRSFAAKMVAISIAYGVLLWKISQH